MVAGDVLSVWGLHVAAGVSGAAWDVMAIVDVGSWRCVDAAI